MSFYTRLLSKLQRVTTSGSFIPVIDGFRFVAIFAVIAFHLEGYLLAKVSGLQPTTSLDRGFHALFSSGHYGVQLFFVISGFILGLPFAVWHLNNSRRVDLKSYFWRRVTRLEPPYVINMLVAFVLLLVAHKTEPAELFRHLVSSLAYLHNAIYGAESLINPMAWSLEVEIQFYILAPLLANVFRIESVTTRRILLVLGIAISGLTYPWTIPYVALRLFSNLQYFLAGFLVCDVFLTDWKSKPDSHVAWDFAGCAFSCCLVWLFVSREELVPVVAPFCMAGLFASVFCGPYLSKLFSIPTITTFGGMCYTIYLYHYFVISMVGRLFRTDFLAEHYSAFVLFNLFVYSAPILATSVVGFVLVERPCMNKNWPSLLISKLTSRGSANSQGGADGVKSSLN